MKQPVRFISAIFFTIGSGLSASASAENASHTEIVAAFDGEGWKSSPYLWANGYAIPFITPKCETLDIRPPEVTCVWPSGKRGARGTLGDVLGQDENLVVYIIDWSKRGRKGRTR